MTVEGGEREVAAADPGGAPRRPLPLRVARGTLRALVALLGVVAALVVAAFLLLQTDAFRERVRVFALERLRSAVHGRVYVARLSGDLLDGVTLHDVRITGPAGEPFLRAERIRVDYHLAGFLEREVVLGEVELVRPRVELVRGADGTWNATRVLPFLRGADEPARPDGWGSVVRVDELRLEDGSVAVRTEGAGGLGPLGSALEVVDLNGILRLDRTTRGEERTAVAVEGLSFRLVDPRLDVRHLEGRLAFTPQAVAVEEFRMRTAASDLGGEGVLRDPEEPVVAVSFRAEPLALAEAARFVPGIPLEGRIEGGVRLQGPLEDLELTLEDVALVTPGSRVIAEGVVTTLEGPRMDATVRLDPLAPADARVLWGGYPLEAPVRGTLEVQGDQSRLELQGDLAFEDTRMDVAGTLALAGRQPAYDVRADVRALDLHDFLDAPAWSSTFQGTFRIAGVGLGTSATAEFSGEVTDSRILFYDVAAASFRGRFTPGAFVADTFHVVLPQSEIWGSGTLPYDYTLALDLRAVSRELSDFYPGLGPTPAARFEGEGTLSGPFSGIDLTLEGVADSIAWKGMLADTMVAAASFTDLGRPGFEMALEGTAAAVDYLGPLDFETAEFQAGYARDTMALAVGVAMDSLRTAEGRLRVEFGGATPRMVLDDGVVHLRPGDWRVREPARLVYQDGVFRFDAFALASEDGALELDGILSVDGPQDFTVAAEDVPLVALFAAAGRPRPATTRGRFLLDGTARVSGTDQAPVVAAELAVHERGDTTGVPRLSGTLAYAERELEAELAFRLRPRPPQPGRDLGTVLLSGSFPVDLTFGPVERRIPNRPMDVSVRSEGATLAIVESFVPAVRGASGAVEVDVRITGTPAEPRFEGHVQVREGAFRFGAEGPRYTGLDGGARFDNDEITFENVRVSSGTGEASLEGRIAVRGLTLGEIDAALRARDFTLLDEDGREVVVDAEIELAGTTLEPTITGTVNVERLEWPLPESTERDVIDLDEAILYVRAEGDTVPREPPPDIWRETQLDLTIQIEDDAFLRSEAALIVLQGELTVEKARGQELPEIAGTLEVVRGFYADFGTQFEITEGEIFFYGTPELNPGLHIVGTQTVTDEVTGADVELTLTIGGTARSPTLNVSSSGDYEPSEIFSLMLFGRPSPSDPGEAARFESTISRVATRQAALPLQRALVSELGLDLLEIQPALGGGESVFRVGKFVSDDVFVTYSQRVGGPLESESVFSLQYRLSRKWTVETHAGTRQVGLDVFYEFRY